MNYRSIGSIAVLLSFAAFSVAGQTPSKQRLDAIWEAVDDRVSRQVDVWFENGDYPKSIHLLEIEANYAPHDYDVVTNLGWMQENIEEWDQALKTYEVYLKNNPQDRDAALPVAQYYYAKKNYQKIPPILEPTLARHPHPNIYRILAHTYEKLNRLQDSKRVWMSYIALAPRDRAAKVNLNRVEGKIGTKNSP